MVGGITLSSAADHEDYPRMSAGIPCIVCFSRGEEWTRMPTAGGERLIVTDCRKTRSARDRWLSKPENTVLKNLGPSNQLNRILGIEGGFEADYARVTLKSLMEYAGKVGDDWKAFQASLTMGEYEQWYSEWKVRLEALKGASNPQLKQIDALHEHLTGYYELYHQATVKKFASQISLSIMHVDGIDIERAAIRCTLHDNNRSRASFHLTGHIVPRLGFLYWELGLEPLGAVCYAICYGIKGRMVPGAILRGIFLT